MFEIRSKNTYEEFLHATQSIAAARASFYKAPPKPRTGLYALLALSVIIEGISIWFAVAEKSEFFSAISIFFGMLILMYILMIVNAKNRAKNAFRSKQAEKEIFDIWSSDKQLKDCDETIRFDEDGVEAVRSFGSFKAGYDCVFKLVETQTNLYILLSLTRFVNVRKESITKEQYDFLLSHCCSGEDMHIKLY